MRTKTQLQVIINRNRKLEKTVPSYANTTVLLSAFVCFSPAPREEDGSGAVSPEVKGYSPHIPKGDTQDSVPTSRLPPSDKG